MKTRRRAGLQTMAHVAAGHHGDSAARALCRGADGLAQFRQARLTRIIEAKQHHRPAPAGIGKMPQGHHHAMIQFRIIQPPNLHSAIRPPPQSSRQAFRPPANPPQRLARRIETTSR